ncbi:MAG: DNA polymerase/3'-5' exonuclease PolX [Anaerolineales bacterium]
MNNREAADVFRHIADLLEIKGEAIYRVLAYRRAADAIQELGRDLHDIWEQGELQEIPGVGKAIAEKIDELLRTGKLEYYERLAAEIPPGLVEVLAVGDVGPKKAARFWKELNITSIEELEKAAREGRLQQLSGMGAKSEARILANIQALKERSTDRILLDKAAGTAETLLAQLRALPGVERAEPAGSLRRFRETVGDLDLIIAAEDPGPVLDSFTGFPQVARILGQGDTKASVALHDGTRVQAWVHPPEHFGSAWQYATGSQAHSVRLRELALKMGLSLSEHGFKNENGEDLTCASEAEVYAALKMPWIPPELREDRGEIQAAEKGELPNLVQLGDLKGELHAHSDWSDGGVSMRTMVGAAMDLGLEYFVISDHSQSLGVANGLTVDRLKAQRDEIAQIQAEIGDSLQILHGSEVEILSDGSLDFPDEILGELDLVIASLHMSLRQPREVVTERMLAAIANPHVDIIGHPTGRLIGKRDAADLDMERVLQAAAEHQVALEINANPERLDLRDVHVRMAIDAGCRLAINTDAHHPDHLLFRIFGVGTARRGWAPTRSIINAWSLEEVREWLDQRRAPHSLRNR